MNKLLLSTAIVLGLTGATFAVPGTAGAADVGISFNTGNVAFGYQDGYWDRDHHWHHWRNRREARYYRDAPDNHYYGWRHDRDPDQGWRDSGPGGPIPGAVGLSFNIGDVAFGYEDGYWDRGHNWHQWRNRREARRYRDTHGSRYNHWRHDRDADQGWRDDGPDGPGPGPDGPGPGPGPGPGGQN